MSTDATRGIRGAITASDNTEEAILEASSVLLEAMIEKNDVQIEDICSIFFSVTPDLDQAFPAQSARQLGLLSTPLLCMTEIPVKTGLPQCIRILIHVNTSKAQKEIQHLYLRGAQVLRPDLK